MLTRQYAKARKVNKDIVPITIRMPKYVDLSPFWTDDKNLSIQQAREKTGLDKRTLSAAKKGLLDRAHLETLYKLKDLASELAGKPLSLEEIIRDDTAQV